MYSIYFYRVYETGMEIDLGYLEKQLPDIHSRTRFSRVKTKSMQIENPPLLIRLANIQDNFANNTIEFIAYSRIYDIGAISICLQLFDNMDERYSLEKLALVFAGQKGLDQIFNEKISLVRELLQPYLGEIVIDNDFYEDYTIYNIKETQQIDDPLVILMGEKEDFSEQIRERVLRNRLSYTSGDYAIVTWDTALLCDYEDAGDLRDLIEFANVQLLELRYYDTILSKQMETMYDDIELAGKRRSYWRLGQYREISTALMRFIADITEVTEKINNLIKITEDVYYARVYQTTLRVLRAEQWNQSVNRKLSVMQQNYSLLANEVTIQHSNILEWIIIILIAMEFCFAILTSLL